MKADAFFVRCECESRKEGMVSQFTECQFKIVVTVRKSRHHDVVARLLMRAAWVPRFLIFPAPEDLP